VGATGVVLSAMKCFRMDESLMTCSSLPCHVVVFSVGGGGQNESGLRKENTSLRQIVKHKLGQQAPKVFEECCAEQSPIFDDIIKNGKEITCGGGGGK